MNKPSCYAPWITTYEVSNGDIVPCCEFDFNKPIIATTEHVSLDDRFNHPNMVNLKNHLLTSDVLPSSCEGCQKEEDAGLRSMRNEFGRIVERSDTYKFNPDEYKLLWLDYRESNLCNFSCKMCGSELSSTHAKIDGVHGKTGILKNPHKLQMYLDKLDDVQIVQFLGGEPTLTDSMYIILKEIRSRNLQHNMCMAIVTNGSLIQRHEDNLLELFEGFIEVDLSISIDVTGEHHNYWRHKNTWKTVEENINKIYKWKQLHSNMKCNTRTALSWPTAYASRAVFDMFKDVDDIGQRWNLVTQPLGLSIVQLSTEELDKLAEYWKDYPDVQNAFANTISDQSIRELVERKIAIRRHDKWHGNSFVDAFPEFKDFYNKIIVQ